MNKHHIRSLALGAVLSVAMGGTALAGVINFSTATPNTNLGASATFTQSGVTMAAYAVQEPRSNDRNDSACKDNGTVSSPCLFYKVTTNDPIETGLGLTPNSDKEIFYPNGIALQVWTPNEYLSSLDLGSVQTGESWQVMGCTGMLSGGFSGCTSLDEGLGPNTDNGLAEVMVSGLNMTHYDAYVVDVPCANSSSCMGGTTDSATRGIHIPRPILKLLIGKIRKAILVSFLFWIKKNKHRGTRWAAMSGRAKR
jgi:hypothetical protein